MVPGLILKRIVQGVCITCCLLGSFAAVSQQQPHIDSVFSRSANLPVENVYLHLDKYSCSSKDSIWFNAYIFTNNQPASISTNLYVELFNNQANLISRSIFPIKQGESHGQVAIPDSLPSGVYWLRAYSRYQMNFDASQLFTVPVTIYDVHDKKMVIAKKRAAYFPVVSTTTDSSLYWVSTPTDSGVKVNLIGDGRSSLLGKSLCVLLASNRHPLCVATVTLTGDNWTRELFFSNKYITPDQGYVDLLLLDKSRLLMRQSVPVIQPKPENILVVQPENMDTRAMAFNDWGLSVTTPELYDASISVVDADLSVAQPSSILQASTPDPLPYEFAWKGEWPLVQLMDTTALSWAGTVRRDNNKRVQYGELVAMISTDSMVKQTKLVPIDSTGRFLVNKADFTDTGKMSFQLNRVAVSETDKQIKLIFDRPYYPAFSIPSPTLWEDSTYLFDSTRVVSNFNSVPNIPQGFKVKELPEAIVRHQLDVRRELNERYATGIFSELTPYSFDLRTERRYNDLWAYLRMKVPGIEGGLNISDVPTLDGRKIIFYVDERLQDYRDLQQYWFSEIAYVKVFTSFWVDDTPFMRWKTGYCGFTLSSSGGGLATPSQRDPAVICIYTRKGTDIRTAPGGLRKIPVAGFSSSSRFKSKLSNKETLYWKPKVELASNKEYHIQFYNNKTVKRYRIIIEGVSKEGQILHIDQVINPAEKNWVVRNP